MTSKAKILLPTSLGALGGVYLVLFRAPWKFLVLVAIACILLALLWSAYRWFDRSPIRWALVLESWILFLPVVTALAVFILLWSTIRVEPASLARLPGWSGKQMADLIKYLAGIVTGLAAAVVSEDPEKNIFWPDFQFRRVAGRAVVGSAKQDSVRYWAAYMPTTLKNEAKGWGFWARRIRARQLAIAP